ncbi:MAG: DUF6580 family putative transport protein [bacterium]
MEVYQISVLKMKKLLGASLLIFIGVLGRTVYHIAPNIEFVTASSLLAGSFLDFPYAFLVPFAVMVLSDSILGNTNIFVFTWSAYIIAGLLGLKLRSFRGDEVGLTFSATSYGALFSFFFFLYTNFGWWFLTSFYPHTLEGLVRCYVAGLPFLLLNLFGNLIIVPTTFGIVLLGKLIFERAREQKKRPLLIIQDMGSLFSPTHRFVRSS